MLAMPFISTLSIYPHCNLNSMTKPDLSGRFETLRECTQTAVAVAYTV